MPSMVIPKGQVALVVGAQGGIGAATAKRYVEAGADVMLSDVSEKVHDVAKDIAESFPERKVHAFVADAVSEEDVKALAEDIRQKFGRLDHLALVQGILHKSAPVECLEYDEWKRVFGVNINSNFLVSKTMIPMLKADGGGTIVTVSSYWGQSGRPEYSAYCASKAANSGLVQSLALELAPAVRVNAVAPGHVKTEMHENALQQLADETHLTKEEVRQREWGDIPMGDGGDVCSLADSIVYLSSPASAYITGITLDVNGGIHFR